MAPEVPPARSAGESVRGGPRTGGAVYRASKARLAALTEAELDLWVRSRYQRSLRACTEMAQGLQRLQAQLRDEGARAELVRREVQEAAVKAVAASGRAVEALGERAVGMAGELSTLEAWAEQRIDLDAVREARKRALGVLTAAGKLLPAKQAAAPGASQL